MPMTRPNCGENMVAIAAICSAPMRRGIGSFEVDPALVSKPAIRRPEILSSRLPHQLAQIDRDVVGFAYCNQFKPRSGDHSSVKVSVDLSPLTQGIGRRRVIWDSHVIHLPYPNAGGSDMPYWARQIRAAANGRNDSTWF